MFKNNGKMGRSWISVALLWCLAVGNVWSSDKKEPLYALYPGEFVIGALFAVHHQPSTALQQGCGEIWEQYGIQRTEVTFHTLDEINGNPNLLPNITLGAAIRDSCWYAPVSLQQTIELVREYMTTDDAQHTCALTDTDEFAEQLTHRREKSHLIGVLGPGPSSVTLQVQNLLQLFSVPQVGYSATSTDLSNKERFSTFFRMVPSDDHQAQALIDLVRYHNWTYVSTINTDENYGQSGITSFRKRIVKYGVCIAHEAQILSTAADKEFDAVVERIRPRHENGEPDAHVVVCFCEGKTVQSLLAAIQRKRLAGHFLLIGSDGWANRGDIAKGFEKEAQGSLTLRIHSPPMSRFDEYYLNLSPYKNHRNPWFKEMWEHQYKCTTSNESNSNIRRCTGYERGPSSKYTQDPKMSFVVRGIYAMAHALHDMQRALCGNTSGACAAIKAFNVTLYKEFLKNVTFWTDENERVRFDRKLEPPESNSRYDIMNYQRLGEKSWDYVQVGKWVGGVLTLNGSIRYSGAGPGPLTTDPTRIESVCSKPCPVGSVKDTLDAQVGDGEKRCCWKCTVCEGKSVQYNETKCRKCSKGWFANDNKTHCIQSPIEYIKFGETAALVVITFACLGSVATILTATVFIKYNHTPVVKSSTRELSYLILFGIIVSHASVFTILAKPSVETCTLSRTLPGISFAMIYASVFTKTNRIARILEGSKKRFQTKKMRFMSGTAQVVISLGLTLGAGVVCGYCLWETPPQTVLQHPGDIRNVLACAAHPRAVLVPLAPALVLLAACAVLAVRTRALPQNFNEAKFIGVATYTTCVIWIAFFPTYFGSDSKSITLCMCVTLSATVTLVFMFFPRLYIVLLHPERNNRAHFITTKSIRCHIGSGLGGPRSGHRERDEILGTEDCRHHELRTISCQTSLERIPRCDELVDFTQPPQSTDWARLDPKPLLEHYKCENQNHYNNSRENNSPSKKSVLLKNPISLSLDVQTHTMIREETVSECSLTDEDSMTQIKDITITLGLSNAVYNRGHCCRDSKDDEQPSNNCKKYF